MVVEGGCRQLLVAETAHTALAHPSRLQHIRKYLYLLRGLEAVSTQPSLMVYVTGHKYKLEAGSK